ncbi:hypothetical protein FH972_025760 [Carpinus fangiana]|uniref:Mediator of RNA polymerase II transcription subunit 1 n=1 Tax=Carpinus fangiana TaxID=176857 RepID=A0A5N6L2C0_9ROSI|nr:hypothetical protein FH972_025760 [Carpinus fangiana]
MTAGIGSPGIHESLGMALSMSTMGVAMGLSSSTLGVNLGTGSSIGPGRMGEDERRRRLEAVLQVIGQRTGMVSQHGLEQLGRRLGLNLAWDSFSTTRIGHGRLLTLAGSQDSFAVDVEFCERPNETDNVVRVTLTYHGLNDAVNEGTGQAGRIMHRNLTTRKDDQGITPALDRFAINLEKLSRMDKLSTAGVSCFEAINGVYTSLKKLHDHETKAAATLLEDRATDQRVEMEVLCKGSGSPKLHARGRLGMQLDYWRSQYLALSRVQTARIPEDCTPMDLDTDTNQTMNNDLFEDDGLTYSLIIECEYSPPHTYPTIRVSTDWISDRVKQSPDDIDSVLNDTNESSPPILHTDWQDPIAFGPAQEGEVHSQARFTAKFDPPICIPFRTAVQIYASVGVDISHELCNVAWHAHILDCLETPLPAAGSPFRTVAYRSLARPSEEPSDYEREVWRASLTIPRAESARVIDSLPFSHPKQLVAVLPILRQYIFLGSLLKKIFPSKPTLSLAAKSERRPNTVHFSQEEHSKRPISGSALNDDIDIFMAASDDEADGKSTTAPQRDQLDAQPPIKSLDIMLRMDGLVGPRLAIAVPPAQSYRDTGESKMVLAESYLRPIFLRALRQNGAPCGTLSRRTLTTLSGASHIYVFSHPDAPSRGQKHLFTLLPTSPPTPALALGSSLENPPSPDTFVENPDFLQVLHSVVAEHAVQDPSVQSQASAFVSQSGSGLGSGGSLFPQNRLKQRQSRSPAADKANKGANGEKRHARHDGSRTDGMSAQGVQLPGGRGGFIHVQDERNPPDWGRIAWPEDILGSLEVDGSGQFVDGTGRYQRSGTYRLVTREGMFGISSFLRDKVKDSLTSIEKNLTTKQS